MVPPDSLIYAPVPTSLLLFDLATGGMGIAGGGTAEALPPDAAQWPALLGGLGELAAWLHAVPLDAAAAGALPREQRLVELVRVELAGGAGVVPAIPPLLREGARTALADFDGATTRCLVHGRLSLGSYACGGGAAGGAAGDGAGALLGWADAGLGTRWFDVGYLLGELVELAATREPGVRGPRRLPGRRAGVHGGVSGPASWGPGRGGA